MQAALIFWTLFLLSHCWNFDLNLLPFTFVPYYCIFQRDYRVKAWAVLQDAFAGPPLCVPGSLCGLSPPPSSLLWDDQLPKQSQHHLDGEQDLNNPWLQSDLPPMLILLFLLRQGRTSTTSTAAMWRDCVGRSWRAPNCHKCKVDF